MEKSLSFFRVFDIAFFAPGILLFSAIWYQYDPDMATSTFAKSEDSTIFAVVALTLSVALIYLLGLLCHAVQRAVREVWERYRSPSSSTDVTPQSAPWFAKLCPAEHHELATYFWYMRATCWNLAVAVIPSSFLFCSCVPGVLLGVVVSFALVLLGADFDRSMHRAVN